MAVNFTDYSTASTRRRPLRIIIEYRCIIILYSVRAASAMYSVYGLFTGACDARVRDINTTSNV